MPTFRFKALTSGGRTDKGMVDADSTRTARAILRSRGLIPIAVDPIEADQKSEAAQPASRRLSENELALVTRQLSSLMTAKLQLTEALAVLVDQSEQGRARELIAAVRSEVLGGHRFADALGRYPRAFPQVYRAMVAAGEDAGDLALVLDRLARYLEERQALRAKILAAMLYPAIVTSVALLIVLFLMTYVVPQVVEVFKHTQQALPWPTQGLLWISGFLRTAGPFLALGLMAGVFVWRAALKNPATRLSWDRRKLKLPLFGKLIRGIEAARFSSTLAILTESGVPMLRALAAARATVENAVLGQAVDQALTRVREGSSLAKALDEQKVFPSVMIHLIRSGEVTGDLSEMLGHAAVNLRGEVERKATTLTTLLEPLLVLVMGVVVLAIVLAVLMPIIEINQLVK